jgi:hypothetical protein
LVTIVGKLLPVCCHTKHQPQPCCCCCCCCFSLAAAAAAWSLRAWVTLWASCCECGSLTAPRPPWLLLPLRAWRWCLPSSWGCTTGQAGLLLPYGVPAAGVCLVSCVGCVLCSVAFALAWCTMGRGRASSSLWCSCCWCLPGELRWLCSL